MKSELKTTLRRAAALMIGLVLAGSVPAIEHWVSTRKAEAKKAAEHTNTAAIDPALQPPPGRYRIATPDQLAGIRLPLTRIVISHRDAEPVYGMGFGVPDELGWRAERAYVAPRTRSEALALARRIEAELRKDPSAIERLAREHSDDRASAPFGGRVGAISSDELSVAQLDAVAPLRAGELSQLFESTQGFELLELEQPPAPQMVSGRRAVIAYRNTLGSRESGEPARDEAFAVAREIAAAVQIGGQPLLDGARARARLNELASGRTGTWSTHDASQATMSSPLELMLLGELPMNGVSVPYDTAYGVAVLQRVPEEPPQPLGYEGVFYRFDPSAPAGPRSRASAMDFAREVVREARLNPERFAELQRQHCCVEPSQILPGLGHFALTRAIERLEVGAIGDEPYVDAAHLVVLKRVEPPPARPLRVQAFELPKPESPDMALLIEHGDGAMLSTATRELVREAAGSLSLDREQERAFIELFDALATQLASGRPGPERMNLVAAALDRARQLLGTELYGRFTTYMAEWTAHRMMHGQ